MSLITEPQVYLTGRQEINREEIDRFLADHNVSHWTTDTEIAGEELVEIGGRLCYLSFVKPRPGGNKAYIEHILAVGHGSVTEHAVWTLIATGISRSACYLPDTEILTRRGWKVLADLLIGEEVLTKCPDTGICRWSTNNDMIQVWYDGDVHWFENSKWKSPAITTDHIVWCGQYDKRRARGLRCREISDTQSEKIVFSKVAGKRIVIDHAIRTDGDDPETITIGNHTYSTTLFFEWLGWVCTDGGCSKSRKACYITQSKTAEWERIREVIESLFPNRWNHHQNKNGHRITVHDADLWQFVVNNFGRLKPERRLFWLFNYSRRLLECFLRGACGGDGHTHHENGHKTLYCPFVEQAGDYQVLFAMTGKAASVRCAALAGREHYLDGVLCTSNLDEIQVSVHKNSASLVQRHHHQSEHYTGWVYCPKTTDGLVYVRREGDGMWNGNSHEIVRHRAGTAYCLDGDTLVWGGGKINGRWDGAKKKWKLSKLFEMSQDPKVKGRLKLMKVRCWDGNYFVQAGIQAITKSGVKPVYEIILSDGKKITSTLEHRFLTPEGWFPIGEIGEEGVVATNGLPKIGLEKEWLRRKYHDENLMIKEIAVQAHCSPHTVRKWIRVFGLCKEMGKGQTGRDAWNKGITYTAGWKHTEETKKLLSEQKAGENNPQWLGDDASPDAGRLRALNMFPAEPCETCGETKGHRHHKDRNTLNNNRDNIEFLCNRCHKLRHVAEDGPSGVLTVKWVRVESIRLVGERMTYDLEVDHDAHNFVANGIVTHNSQLSQRYVDESECNFVIPPLYLEAVRLAQSGGVYEKELYPWAKDADDFYNIMELGNHWLDFINSVSEKYKKLVDLTSDHLIDPSLPTTDRRKQAREAARSVLPNATETKIQLTFNARAIRNFLELRASRHAEKEIRRLANKIYEVMIVESPNLFGDYKKVILDDGSFELTTDNKKV